MPHLHCVVVLQTLVDHHRHLRVDFYFEVSIQADLLQVCLRKDISKTFLIKEKRLYVHRWTSEVFMSQITAAEDEAVDTTGNSARRLVKNIQIFKCVRL